MPEFEITFGSFTGAVKHHWKLILIFLLLFSLLGAGAGYLYAPHDTADIGGQADTLEAIDFRMIVEDGNFHANRRAALNLSCDQCSVYLNTLVGLSSLSSEQKEAILELQNRLSEFSTFSYAPISAKLSATDAIYVPDSYIPTLIEQCENNLAAVQHNLIASEQAVDLLKNMEAPSLENEDTLTYYNNLLKLAYNYGSYLQQQERYTNMLDALKKHTASVRTAGKEMTQMQDAAAEELNALIEDVNALATTLAQDHRLKFTATYDDKENLTVTTTHTHGEATAQDNFLIIWIFCTLVGLCSGAFLAVCKEAGAFPRRSKART